MHIRLAVLLLVLTPPVTAVLILLFVSFPPRLRCTLALGTMFLLTAFTFMALGMGSALIDGRQPFWPYLAVTGVPTATILRMIQMELKNQPDRRPG